MNYQLDLDRWHAVSVPVFVEDKIFLIKRSETMPTFKGHLAFIGGHKKEEETEIEQVAIREFEEETSLSSNHLKVLGFLPVVRTIQGNFITPIALHYKNSAEEFIRNVKTNGEWTHSALVDFDYFLDESRWSFATGKIENIDRNVLFCTIPNRFCMHNDKKPKDLFLWGATAKMLWSLVQLYKS